MKKNRMDTFYAVDVLSGDDNELNVNSVRADFSNGYIELAIKDGGIEVRGMGARAGSLVVRPVVGNVIEVRLK